MRRRWFAICASLLVLGATAIVPAADGGRAGKRPLDLPSGGKPGPDQEEEDQPETILFYGAEFEGDCFVWCFPVYGFCGDTTVYVSIRMEITTAINQLSEQSTFSLVGFNSMTYVWSPTVVPANAVNRSSAIAWMNTLAPIESHCIVEAAITTLGISQSAESDYKQVVVCGAREPYCNGSGGAPYVAAALLQITAANFEQTPLHTVYFSTTFYSGEQAFYQQLASLNSGTFRQVGY